MIGWRTEEMFLACVTPSEKLSWKGIHFYLEWFRYPYSIPSTHYTWENYPHGTQNSKGCVLGKCNLLQCSLATHKCLLTPGHIFFPSHMSAFDELDCTVAIKGKTAFHELSIHNAKKTVCRGTCEPHTNVVCTSSISFQRAKNLYT